MARPGPEVVGSKLPDSVIKFMRKAATGLEPTFVQKLRAFWNETPGLSRVVLVAEGIAIISAAFAVGGVMAWLLGDVSHSQPLSELARGIVRLAGVSFAASAVAYMGIFGYTTL